MNKKLVIWITWSVITIAIASFFAYKMFVAEDKSELLIGEATHGHFQIEMACTTCHTEAFSDEDVMQDACTNCHQEELKAAHDSHPKKKFTDPRNADRLEILDARYCVTCHTEHQDEQTHPMGVTIPEDYCYHCHKEVGEERESHQNLAFDSCATAGCHNYHDNRALYERFLVENSGGPWLKEMARIAGTEKASASQPHDPAWFKESGIEQCKSCHVAEAEGYLQGKHGMRLAQTLSPMTPAQSDLTFKDSALSLEHGCTSCHQTPELDRQFAAVEACLGCHADDHSTSFMASPHGALNAQVKAGELPAEEGVTCATCHMPKIVSEIHGKEKIVVQHNQNDNLRPNEKMIRPVCMSCHSLEFSIDALADEKLIHNNFSGQPADHVPSVDWALKRENR